MRLATRIGQLERALVRHRLRPAPLPPEPAQPRILPDDLDRLSLADQKALLAAMRAQRWASGKVVDNPPIYVDALRPFLDDGGWRGIRANLTAAGLASEGVAAWERLRGELLAAGLVEQCRRAEGQRVGCYATLPTARI